MTDWLTDHVLDILEAIGIIMIAIGVASYSVALAAVFAGAALIVWANLHSLVKR